MVASMYSAVLFMLWSSVWWDILLVMWLGLFISYFWSVLGPHRSSDNLWFVWSLLLVEFLFVVVLFIDGLTIYVFWHHFYYSYIALFVNKTFFSIIERHYLLFAWVVVCLFLWYARWQFQLEKQHKAYGSYALAWCWLLSMLGSWALWYVASTPDKDVFETYVHEQQLWKSTASPYEIIPADPIVVEWRKEDWNVIVLFIESFSLIDSRLWWVNNNLPAFDDIAQDGLTFTNFISNGCTSDSAHVATLFGAWPWSSKIVAWGHYETFTSDFTWLAHFFNALDYETYFVSTASLAFQDQYSFLENAWFENIIGDEAFLWEKTYAFDSAPDAVLYDKILETVRQEDRPFFLSSQTISTHLPYNSPYGQQPDEVWKYANDALADFYAWLKEADFFVDGKLILVSDHRKFDEMTDAERDTRWQWAHGRIVATIVGDGVKPWVDHGMMQHIDIYHMLKQSYGSWDVYTFAGANDPLYTNSLIPWRDRTIRSCTFVDNQLHVVTPEEQFYVTDRPNHPAFTFAASQFLDASEYIWAWSLKKDGSNEQLIDLVGHRGWSIGWQNSMKWVRSVAALWVDAIEIDVAMTADGIVLLTNGHTNNMTCKWRWKIANLSYELIKDRCQTVDNEPLQKVDQALSKMAGMFDSIFLELKVEEWQNVTQFVEEVVEAIRQTWTQDKVTIVSYDMTARLFASTFDDIDVGLDSYTSDDAFWLEWRVYSHFLTEKSSYTKEQVEYTKSLGKKFVVYTLETKAELEEAIEKGVDMVLVNDILQFQTWLEEIQGE